VDLDAIDYIPARYQSQHGGTPTLIVLHSIECPLEGNHRARNVALWFAGPSSPRASAHYIVDVDEVVCGVQPPNVAWHVGRANVYGGSPSIGIEQTGYARFATDEWLSPAGQVQLDRLVGLVAALCDRWGIARRWVDETGLRNGMTGITTHGIATAAGIGTDHTDPGANWPVDEFMARLNGTPAPTPKDDDMPTRSYAFATHATSGVWLLAGWDGRYSEVVSHLDNDAEVTNAGNAFSPANLGDQTALLDVLLDATPRFATAADAATIADSVVSRVGPDVARRVADELATRLRT